MTNHQQRAVDQQVKVDDARFKLKSVYPKLQVWQNTSQLSPLAFPGRSRIIL